MYGIKDCPTRTADYGYFPWERQPEPKVTADMLADAILTGNELAAAPFKDWASLPFAGAYADYSIDESIKIQRAMLLHDGTQQLAMDALSDIVAERYTD